MRLGGVIVWAVAVLWACAAVPAPVEPRAADAAVTSYQPDFFAGRRPNTALDMVVALPGFTLDTGGAVRGFGGAAGNVLIDGDRPATKNDALDEILRRIPASSVARIDVIRGGAPGIDMQGKTVIANVIRKTDEGLKLTTALQGTALFHGRFDHGLRVEGSKRTGAIAFEGSLLLASGADDGTGDGPHTVRNPAGGGVERDQERYFGEQGTNKATAAVDLPLFGGHLRVEGSYLDSPYGSRNDDLSVLPVDHQTERFALAQDTAEVGLRYTQRYGPKVGLEVYALQQLSRFAEYDNLATPTDDTIFTLGKDQGESILRGVVTLDPARNLQIQNGLEGDFNWLTSRTVETDNGLPLFVPAANVHVTELRGEAFSDATWTVTSDLVLEAGIRVEASTLASTGSVVSSERFVYPKPRVVVTWSPDNTDQLQLRAEREVSQLDFGNFAASGSLVNGEHAGNPHLTPQQDWVIEASYDRKFWSGGDASLALRQYWLQDVIDYAPFCASPGPVSPGLCSPADEFDAPANIGSGSKQELAATLTLPTDRSGLKNGQLILRGTWRTSRVTDPSTRHTRGISALHALDAEAHFTQGLPSLKSTWGFDIYPAWRETAYHFNEIDVRTLGLWVDVYFEYKPLPDLSVKVEADNLTQHGLDQVRNFYSPFRDVDGGKLASIDSRNPRFGPELAVRVRKTFG